MTSGRTGRQKKSGFEHGEPVTDTPARPGGEREVRQFRNDCSLSSPTSRIFERCGVSRETAETVTQLPEAFLPYAQSVDTTARSRPVIPSPSTMTELTVDTVQGHSRAN